MLDTRKLVFKRVKKVYDTIIPKSVFRYFCNFLEAIRDFSEVFRDQLAILRVYLIHVFIRLEMLFCHYLIYCLHFVQTKLAVAVDYFALPSEVVLK